MCEHWNGILPKDEVAIGVSDMSGQGISPFCLHGALTTLACGCHKRAIQHVLLGVPIRGPFPAANSYW